VISNGFAEPIILSQPTCSRHRRAPPHESIACLIHKCTRSGAHLNQHRTNPRICLIALQNCVRKAVTDSSDRRESLSPSRDWNETAIHWLCSKPDPSPPPANADLNHIAPVCFPKQLPLRFHNREDQHLFTRPERITAAARALAESCVSTTTGDRPMTRRPHHRSPVSSLLSASTPSARIRLHRPAYRSGGRSGLEPPGTSSHFPRSNAPALRMLRASSRLHFVKQVPNHSRRHTNGFHSLIASAHPFR